MNKIINFVSKELYGDGLFGCIFLLTGVLLQVIAYILGSNSSILSLVSGVSGIFSVVLCSQRKISYYLFAWIQLITYVVLAYQQRLYGELGENVFYAVTMLYGMYFWFKHYNVKDSVVYTKQLSFKYLSIVVWACIVFTIALYKRLSSTDDTQPFMDSISTIPAVIAQILMILCYREQWIFWLIIDVASIWMWTNVGDWCMVSQFVFWTINCIYGFKQWTNHYEKDNYKEIS